MTNGCEYHDVRMIFRSGKGGEEYGASSLPVSVDHERGRVRASGLFARGASFVADGFVPLPDLIEIETER